MPRKGLWKGIFFLETALGHNPYLSGKELGKYVLYTVVGINIFMFDGKVSEKGAFSHRNPSVIASVFHLGDIQGDGMGGLADVDHFVEHNPAFNILEKNVNRAIKDGVTGKFSKFFANLMELAEDDLFFGFSGEFCVSH